MKLSEPQRRVLRQLATRDPGWLTGGRGWRTYESLVVQRYADAAATAC